MGDPQTADPATGGLHRLVERLTAAVVGRVREIELTVAAIASDRHIVIEGPPGTGKSTLLRAVARELGDRVRVRRGQRRAHPGARRRPLRPGARAQRRVRPRRVRPRTARLGAARRVAALHRGAEPGPRGDAERADHGDERARDHRAAARPPRGGARVPARRRHEPVRRGRHRTDLRRGVRPDVSDRRRLPVDGRRGDDRAACHRVRERPADRRSRLDRPRGRTRAGDAHAPRRAGRVVGAWRDRHGVRRALAGRAARDPRPRPEGVARRRARRAVGPYPRARGYDAVRRRTSSRELWESVFNRSTGDGGGDAEGKASAPTGATTSR